MRGEITLTNEKVGVSTEGYEFSDFPTTPTLGQNYPNPFNPSTNIQFTLPQPANVTLKVYDVLGKEVATLVNGNVSAGVHTVRFEARSNMSSGVYFYRLETPDMRVTRKLMLIK